MECALRSGKRSASQELAGPETPHGAKEARREGSHLLALPHELLEKAAVAPMEFQDLCSLAQSCGALRALAEECPLWRREFSRVYGPPGALQEAAAKRAGSWKRLFASRRAALAEAAPWEKPAAFEVEASVGMLAAVPPRKEGEEEEAAELCLVFLVDGSGSVTEEDFRVMTDFMLAAVRGVAAGGPRSKVAVIQFSNDVRVEQGPVDVDVEQFEGLMANMMRMNGGTNIALAVQKAGQLLKPLSTNTHRVLVLLTDGRIDSHQAREAHEMAGRLADEQANVRLHAYGVGRGVDREELLKIISARDPDTAADRYLGLMVLDEAPW